MNIFNIIRVGWLLSEILLHRLFRSKKNRDRNSDGNSLRLVWIVIAISITLGVLCSIYLPVIILHAAWVAHLGLILILGGIVIRIFSIHTLGRFFSVNLGIENNHEVVRAGPYKYIRHPSYTGSLLSFFGMGLSFNNWVSLAIIFLPVLITFIYRINVEENLLLTQFGSEYKAYMDQTKRLIPFIY